MVTIINEKLIDEVEPEQQTLATAHAFEASNQFLLQNTFISHNPKSGLNPLVDAAAYLFSIMGKLKQLKSYRQLSKLRKELIQEINTFQDTAKSHGYSSEYILVSRYALCATLDDIINNTPWGAQGQWDAQNLMAAFNQEAINQERFFIILERLIKDPNLYIDVMEFMYICLSLGFKGHYRATEFNQNQLDQITNALYKRIRAHRGDFSKVLSPFPIKPPHTSNKATARHMPTWVMGLLVVGLCMTFFAGIRYTLDATSTQAFQDLTRTGKNITYETNDTSTA